MRRDEEEAIPLRNFNSEFADADSVNSTNQKTSRFPFRRKPKTERTFQVGTSNLNFEPNMEGYDDYARYLTDKASTKLRQEANSQLYTKVTLTGKKLIPSSAIAVGDILELSKNSRVPADCVFLKSSDAMGTCFLRTDQLDGETDWKLKLACSTTQKFQNPQEMLDSNLEIYAEAPQKDIHSFFGRLTLRNGSNNVEEPLSVDNAMWMNTVVASENIVVCVVYTGTDTKAVQNTSFAPTKVGLVDLEINALSKILAFVTLALSILMVALDGFKGLWYIYLMRFLIVFSSIIPISMRVNLDMGKTVYSYLIMNDHKIKNTIVRTSTIPEELGRIDYILTDKTGTLTRNEMEMKKLHMGTMSFDSEAMEDIRAQLAQAFENNKGKEVGIGFKQHVGMFSRVKDILIALALCHNVTPAMDENGTVTFQAASPDEIAIVKWTWSMGLKLVHRDITTIKLQYRDKIMEFKILRVFPFTSESKRMGIIIQDQTNDITFYQKGADTIMTKIVMANDWLDEECANMAREGLRTLVVGRKQLSKEIYEEFEEQYKLAKLSAFNRAEKTQTVVSTYLERDLELLGLTGVEDQLQENVKATLELLRNAGIKIWMLTGDKIETATCIARSSKLFARNQMIVQLSSVNTVPAALEKLDQLRSHGECCLVIDGSTLQFYLDHLSQELISVALQLPAVVCSRCTPTQKADIVRLINSSTKKRTCAVGDGGNDVSMIQAANVGIGIVGKEGKQASLAADFSITQFQHLSRLLLWHGRNSYHRSSKLAHFVMHRGLTISTIQAVFSALFYFAPIALYQGFILIGYTTVYTMAPVFSIVYDHDISEETALFYPELYKELLKGRMLSYKTFVKWLFISVYQGGVIMILAIWLFENEFIRIVSISFTALIFNELLMVAMEVNTWHTVMVVAQLGTMALYIGSMWFLPDYFDVEFIATLAFVWKVGLIAAVSLVPVYVYSSILFYFSPPSYSKLS